MAAALGAANPNTVVVARCPGACHMPWASAVPSILFEMLPGQESGNSIATTIFVRGGGGGGGVCVCVWGGGGVAIN